MLSYNAIGRADGEESWNLGTTESGRDGVGHPARLNLNLVRLVIDAILPSPTLPLRSRMRHPATISLVAVVFRLVWAVYRDAEVFGLVLA